MTIKIFFLCSFIFFPFIQAFSQNPVPPQEDTLRKNALKIFLDCPMCDEDYIRQNVLFINYVRDRKEAQVHVMVTSQSTGSGGRAYTFHFFGQKEFAGMNDTLVYASSTDDTKDMIRKGQVETLKIGLMRYVARTPLAKDIRIRFNKPAHEKAVEDKWKSWVFDLRASGFLNGQKARNSYYLYGSVVARKVTPEWKYNLSANYNINEDKITTDNEVIHSSLKSKSLYGLVVKSISDHWSVGGRGSASSSSFSNYKFHFSAYPGIEYDLFPYSESTRKQLRILYTLGYSYNAYVDTTIYNKTKESLFGHSLDISFEVTQKWGSVETSVNWSNYFHDWSKNNLSVNGYMNVRLFKGFSVNFGGSVSMIHDQINLVKGGASTEEILLYRKELETRYRFDANFGITYTFGSIYNNVVNPRFGNSSGHIIYMY